MDEIELKPVTPGELLREEFLVPMGISKYRLAKEIGVPAQRIGEIVAGRVLSPRTPICVCASSSGCQRLRCGAGKNRGSEGAVARTREDQAMVGTGRRTSTYGLSQEGRRGDGYGRMANQWVSYMFVIESGEEAGEGGGRRGRSERESTEQARSGGAGRRAVNGSRTLRQSRTVRRTQDAGGDMRASGSTRCPALTEQSRRRLDNRSETGRPSVTERGRGVACRVRVKQQGASEDIVRPAATERGQGVAEEGKLEFFAGLRGEDRVVRECAWPCRRDRSLHRRR